MAWLGVGRGDHAFAELAVAQHRASLYLAEALIAKVDKLRNSEQMNLGRQKCIAQKAHRMVGLRRDKKQCGAAGDLCALIYASR